MWFMEDSRAACNRKSLPIAHRVRVDRHRRSGEVYPTKQHSCRPGDGGLKTFWCTSIALNLMLLSGFSLIPTIQGSASGGATALDDEGSDKQKHSSQDSEFGRVDSSSLTLEATASTLKVSVTKSKHRCRI